MTSDYMAKICKILMQDVLGYTQFGVAGGDIGGRVARMLSFANPEVITGRHLTDIGYMGDPIFPAEFADLTAAEQEYLDGTQYWFMSEGAYIMQQATKPQTLAYSLNDSPVGLAGWIIEKFYAWSDCAGEIESRFSKDEVLTNLMIYWVSQSIASSIRVYAEDGANGSVIRVGQYIEVPTGVALFIKETVLPPRSMAERYLRIKHWSTLEKGGHFAALEEPELLAQELRTFFANLSPAS